MSDSMTPAQRSMRGSAAAYARWAKEGNRTAATRPALHGFLARFERQVDPDGTLKDEERIKRAYSAMRAYMSALALKSSRTRAAKRRPAKKSTRGAA